MAKPPSYGSGPAHVNNREHLRLVRVTHFGQNREREILLPDCDFCGNPQRNGRLILSRFAPEKRGAELAWDRELRIRCPTAHVHSSFDT